MSRKDHNLPERRNNVDLKRIDQLANFLDNTFKIPGTDKSFGIDPLLGFIPIAGDLVSYAMSMLLIYYSAKYGASGKVVTKMMGNVLVDFAVGKIPVLGIIFDFAYKANDRNVKLLKEHYNEDKHQGSAWKYLFIYFAIATALMLAFVGFGIWISVLLYEWVSGLFV